MANASEPAYGLRVGVKNGGCAGMSYTMDFAQAARPGDEVVEDRGVRILVDPKAVLFLLGTQLDFKTDKLSAQFVFENPNQTSACGCGESVAITPVAAPGCCRPHGLATSGAMLAARQPCLTPSEDDLPESRPRVRHARSDDPKAPSSLGLSPFSRTGRSRNEGT